MILRICLDDGRAETGAQPKSSACLCPAEIPNVHTITACLRRQKANLSEAYRVVFEQ